MRHNTKGALAGIGIISAIVFVYCLAFYCINRVRCDHAWQGSGMRTSYGLLQGCLVEAAPNKWIPEDRYREVK